MKPFMLLLQFFGILSSFFIAQISSAYLQYTYSSDVLEWQSTFVNDTDFGEEINNDDDGNIIFNFSFDIDENLLSDAAPTSFIIKNANVVSDTSLGDFFYDLDFHSLVYGRVIINPDRTINYWNLILDLAIRDPRESDRLNNLRDHDIRIISGGGLNTCNCDRFWEDINVTTQRPYNTWIIAATIDNQYRNDSSFAHWSVAQTQVAEPGSLLLVFIGLVGFLMLRRKENN